jgi:hypothetical protein
VRALTFVGHLCVKWRRYYYVHFMDEETKDQVQHSS